MDFVKFERREHVGIVTLDRAPINALTMQMYLELAEAFGLVAADKDVRAVLLRAEGDKFYSAGNDVHDFASPDMRPAEYAAAVNLGVGSVFRCDVPVVCACNGTAVGAGFTMMAGADVVFSVEHARFGLPEAVVGVIGGGPEASYSLPPNVVKYLILSGNTMSAAELHRVGFIHEITPPEELFDRAFALARKMSKYPPIAMRESKRSLQRIYGMEELLTVHAVSDRAATIEHRRHPDFLEAVTAFLEKREPHFTGE